MSTGMLRWGEGVPLVPRNDETASIREVAKELAEQEKVADRLRAKMEATRELLQHLKGEEDRLVVLEKIAAVTDWAREQGFIAPAVNAVPPTAAAFESQSPSDSWKPQTIQDMLQTADYLRMIDRRIGHESDVTSYAKGQPTAGGETLLIDAGKGFNDILAFFGVENLSRRVFRADFILTQGSMSIEMRGSNASSQVRLAEDIKPNQRYSLELWRDGGKPRGNFNGHAAFFTESFANDTDYLTLVMSRQCSILFYSISFSDRIDDGGK